jgi:hypothetical protein
LGFDSKNDVNEAPKFERIADRKKRLEAEEKKAAYEAKLAQAGSAPKGQ